MDRCLPPSQSTRRTALAALALSTLTLLPTTQARTLRRNFPAKALRGTMVIMRPPLITMDGVEARLSPGSRIFDTDNLMVLSGKLIGETLTVNYVLTSQGQVQDIWILTDAEAAAERPRAADLSN